MFIQQFVIGTDYKVKQRIKNRIAVTCNIVYREDKLYLWGAERYTVKMCNALQKKYDIHLFQYASDSFGLDNVTIHSKTNNFFSKEKLCETARKIQQLSPQCILCNAGTGHQALYWLIISKMTNVPIIIFFHNEPKYIKDTLDITHGLEYIVNQVKNKTKDKLYDMILSYSDKIAFLLPQYIDEKYKNKSYVFYNCVDILTDVDIETHRDRFLYVGRINSTVKRTNLLLDCIKYTDYKLDVAGYSYFENGYIDMNGYSDYDNISYYGYQKDVSQYYKKAYALVIPSIYEGLPTVALEAMSYGVPIIGYEECKAMNDLIQDGYNGWLVKDDLLSILNKSMEYNNIRWIRQNCIDYVKQYDISVIAEKISGAIDDVL